MRLCFKSKQESPSDNSIGFWPLWTFILVSVLVFITPPCFAEKPLTDEEYKALWRKPNKSADDFGVLNRERKYRVFRPVNAFMTQVLLRGSASKLGLDHESLDDYLKLRFTNNLKDYRLDPDQNDFEGIAFFVVPFGL